MTDTPQAATEPRKDSVVTITLTPADGGALLSIAAEGPHGSSGSRAIVGGDLSSDAAKRKVQRQAIRWIKNAFPAPKRVKKAAAPA